MRLANFRVGTGHHVTLLLHGFLGSGKNLRTLAQRWCEREPSRVFLLMDLRGHGESPSLSDSSTAAEMGADVLDTARAEGLQGPFDIVGHSLGGRVALAASLWAPGEVKQVTLLDITPSPLASDVSESGAVLKILLAAPAQAPDRRTLRAWFVAHGLAGPLADWLLMNVVERAGEYVWRFDRPALARLHERVNHEDLWSAVERPGAKVRCVRGTNSPYVSAADTIRMERAGCDVIALEGAGHYVHVDALDRLVELLAEWPSHAQRP